jgi:hypothetical protein
LLIPEPGRLIYLTDLDEITAADLELIKMLVAGPAAKAATPKLKAPAAWRYSANGSALWPQFSPDSEF